MVPGPKAAIAAAALFLTAVVTVPACAQDQTMYFLINGPDFRQVSEGEFDQMRSSCMRIERKSYPDDHVVEWHCYL
jgi:hypothetical protein